MSEVKRIVPSAKKVTAKKATKKVAAKKAPAKKIPIVKDGITFPDPGFHIAVLGALLDMGAIRPSLIEKSLAGLEVDDDASETDRLLAAMARLHALKLDPKKVARIESLDFDGGNEIYMLLEDGAGTYTGGEDDTYSLLAITGIAALCKLKTLNLDGHGYRTQTLDLKPLAEHPALETLQLSGKCKAAKTLETLPRLASLDLQLGSIDAPSVLDRLAKRGVEVLRGT